MSACDHTAKQFLTAFGDAGDAVFGRSAAEVRQLEAENSPVSNGPPEGCSSGRVGRDEGGVGQESAPPRCQSGLSGIMMPVALPSVEGRAFPGWVLVGRSQVLVLGVMTVFQGCLGSCCLRTRRR